jgi:hypothetical protein
MTILTRATHEPSKRDRLIDYSTRLIDTPDFDHLYHGARIERGRKVQDNIVRLPIPRHRALIVRDPQ